ncbi:sigma-70 family RNA polymerase sigma factor [Aquisphaera insulae]|uniref:sigma-70 family RNA polymerase sigma factor n=1 Tax=Aquisphaera insulae TaxID=2712864 RepID=UPI0013EBD714|nr:sigma-70 family RNA polymerase sigma factor [Aquisphaera insulae]
MTIEAIRGTRGTGAGTAAMGRLLSRGVLTGLGDDALLERFLADRDEEAFAAIVARHGPMVMRVCRGVVRNASDAEDAFQASFLILVKKARSFAGVSRPDVGGWLHRVAYRVAIQANAAAARRHAQERKAAMAATAYGSPAESDEVTPAVHEELARLPESIRSALVLCELRGVSQPEAAAALRTSERTLRRRLAKGRERLRARLMRRGLAPASGEATLAALALRPREAELALLQGWRDAAVRAATRGLEPAAAGPAARLALATACALGLVATAWAAALQPGQAPGPPVAAVAVAVAPPAPREAPADVPPVVPHDGPIEVKGRVVDPDGKPLAAAVVHASWNYLFSRETLAARTGADGRFVVKAPWPRDRRETGAAAPLQLAATAPGFGPGWVRAEVRPGAPGSPDIRLVRDGPPIEGRIVDRAGRPIAGAAVKVESLWYGANGTLDPVETGDLGPWLRDIRSPEPGKGDMPHMIYGGDPRLQPIGLPAAGFVPAATDADGRFRIAGIGRERIVTLKVSGPGLATTSVSAIGRDEPDIRIKDHAMQGEPGPVVHGRRFEHAVGPSRPIEGTIRDAETGRPIAGMSFMGVAIEKPGYGGLAESTSDAQGRYRLDGLAEVDAYLLTIRPGPGQPYVNARLKVTADADAAKAKAKAKGPIRFDISLRRGYFVRGRVIEKGTDRPMKGAVWALALRENPHLGEYPGFGEWGPNTGEIDPDGRFEVVVLPGPGLVLYSANDGRHVAQHKAATIPATVPENHGDCDAMARVDLVPNGPVPELDLRVSANSRRAFRIEAVDEQGRPVSGARIWGPDGSESSPEQDSPAFELVPFELARSRRATILHDGRKLIGSVELNPDEPGPSPVVVRLVPWGTIVGRIVDGDGRPGGSFTLLCLPDAFDPHQADNANLAQAVDGNFLRKRHQMPRIKADADGRFRVEGIVPGAKYQALVSGAGDIPSLDVIQYFEVEPGEVKDLGEFVVRAPARPGQPIAPPKMIVR